MATRNTQCYNSPIGIDTVRLSVQRFTIGADTPLTVCSSDKTSTGETDDGPLYRIGGDGPLVEGVRAYLNVDDVRITIRGPELLSVSASLPKLLRSKNLHPVVSAEELTRALDVIEETLAEQGIAADLRDATIARLDVCRNFRTEDPLTDYAPLLRRMTFPRTKRREYEDGGIWWKNKTRQLQVYAKGLELGTKDDRLQRMEYRLIRGQGVRHHVGVSTVSDLVGSFENARDAFRSAAKKLLPEETAVPEVRVECPESSIQTVLDALDGLSSRPHSDLLKALGAQYLQDAGAVESFLVALRERSGRMTENRYRKKFEELAPIGDLFSSDEWTGTEMIEELRAKLLA